MKERLPSVDPCPLCGARRAAVVEKREYTQVWAWLEEVWGARVPDDVRTANTPTPHTTLVDCEECGLGYFHPLVPGDAAFYAEVMAEVPYEESRWEFGLVADRLDEGARVVDFGCGEGAFLARVRDRVARAVGVDHNPRATLRASAAGIEVSTEPFEDFAAAHQGGFSTACGFHVIEHVERVDDLLGPMLTCLARPGRLFLSVPNRDRVVTASAEPLDHPPHHLSRWRLAQLEALARRHHLDLVAVDFEPPDFWAAIVATREHWAWRMSLQRSPGGLAGFAAKVVTKVTLPERRYQRLVETGHYRGHRIFGHTMLAEFEVA